MDQLEQILAEEKEVLFGTEVIKIKTFRVKDISTIAKIMSSVFEAIGNGKEIDQSTLVKLLMSSFADNSDNILKLISSATSLDKKKLEELSLASVTFLIKHIVGQNIEFFQLHMLPQIKELMTSVEGAAQKNQKKDGEK